MRRAAHVDRNQPQIVDALRKVGASVQHLHQVGKGCPDLLVGFRRQTFLLEVKPDVTTTRDRNPNALEEMWHRIWRGLPVAVVHTPEEALVAIGAVSPGDSNVSNVSTCNTKHGATGKNGP